MAAFAKPGFVACVKVDGRILRDGADGVVNLPFGCEFTLLLKNMQSRRALAKVSIDGTDVTDGTRLILQANGSLELARYIRNGNLDRGNAFRFIERTAGVEAHKGVGAEDGLVRVEFWQEVQAPLIRHVETVYHSRPRPLPQYPYPRWGYPDGVVFANTMNEASFGVGTSAHVSHEAGGSPLSKSVAPRILLGATKSAAETLPANDAGITVPGSESSQRFTHGSWFQTESASHVIVLQLRGEIGGQAVRVPVTVKTKPECRTCGTKAKAGVAFCGKCGTALTLI